MNTIDKLAWIYLDAKKILVARSKGKNLFYIPGGKREQGESDIDALIREIKEELCVDLITSSIKPAGIFIAPAHDKPEHSLVNMTCYFADFSGALKPAAEIEEIAWFSGSDKSKCSPVTQMIMDWLITKNMME